MGEQQALSGFTLIELITILLLVGILAVFAVSRLDIGIYRSAGFFQQASTSIRFAQKLAVSSNCSVRVEISGSGCFLTWNSCGAASGVAIANPSSGDTDFCRGGGASVSPAANFSFDRIGRPVDSGNLDTRLGTQTFAIGDRNLRVEAETGYTHEI